MIHMNKLTVYVVNVLIMLQKNAANNLDIKGVERGNRQTNKEDIEVLSTIKIRNLEYIWTDYEGAEILFVTA